MAFVRTIFLLWNAATTISALHIPFRNSDVTLSEHQRLAITTTIMLPPQYTKIAITNEDIKSNLVEGNKVHYFAKLLDADMIDIERPVITTTATKTETMTSIATVTAERFTTITIRGQA